MTMSSRAIAHDINNQLAVIQAYAELALGGLDGGDVGRELREIKRAAERAAALTEDLLLPDGQDGES